MRKKIFILFYCIILYVPLVLGFMANICRLPFDVPLEGYTASAEKPKFTPANFLSGSFQTDYTAWLDQNIKPRGILTKTYSTVRYNLFNLGNRPIGYHHDIFESHYIDNELVINEAKDLSDPGNQREMEEYVDKLEQVQSLLAQCGKTLYLYVTPNKADFHYENILNAYKNMASGTAVKPIDYFDDLIAETDIPHIICREKAPELQYPAFYTTGIHWARPFEQEVSAQIVRELAELTHKNYRNILLGPVDQRDFPYWRDADVYAMQNVWNKIDGQQYYEY